MKISNKSALAAAIVGIAMASQAGATTILANDGFESDALNSTPAANGYSVFNSGSTMAGAIKSTPVHGGTKSLVFAPINTATTSSQNYGYAWKDTVIPNMGATAEPILYADVWINRSGSAIAARRDTFTGLEMFGTDADGNAVEVGGVGIYGSTTGYQLAFLADGKQTVSGDPNLVYYVTTGTAYTTSTWMELTMVADYSSQTFSVYWNGSGYANIPFINTVVSATNTTPNAPATGLTDTDMSLDNHHNETVAFDDYFIATLAPVPEPTSMAMAAPALALLARRRRA